MTGLQKQLQTANPYPLSNSGAIRRSLFFFIEEFSQSVSGLFFRTMLPTPKLLGSPLQARSAGAAPAALTPAGSWHGLVAETSIHGHATPAPSACFDILRAKCLTDTRWNEL